MGGHCGCGCGCGDDWSCGLMASADQAQAAVTAVQVAKAPVEVRADRLCWLDGGMSD